jgi:hypothetical protein
MLGLFQPEGSGILMLHCDPTLRCEGEGIHWSSVVFESGAARSVLLTICPQRLARKDKKRMMHLDIHEESDMIVTADNACRRGGPLDFERILREVAKFFEREGFNYAIIGAFALHAYGRSRATRDLDFVAESQAQQNLIAFLETMGYETLHVSSGYSTHLHRDPAMGRLDFVYVSSGTSQQLFGSAQRLLVLPGMSVPVPRAEHLAAMKIHAMKNDPKRTFQEMADILFLMQLPGINKMEIRRYFEKQGLSDRYDEIQKILETS